MDKFEMLVNELMATTQAATAMQQVGGFATIDQVHDMLKRRDAARTAVIAAYRELELDREMESDWADIPRQPAENNGTWE